MASNRSSYLTLYSSEDVTDNAFKVQVENKQAEVAFTGSQPIKFDFVVQFGDKFVRRKTRFHIDAESLTVRIVMWQTHLDVWDVVFAICFLSLTHIQIRNTSCC